MTSSEQKTLDVDGAEVVMQSLRQRCACIKLQHVCDDSALSGRTRILVLQGAIAEAQATYVPAEDPIMTVAHMRLESACYEILESRLGFPFNGPEPMPPPAEPERTLLILEPIIS